MAYFVMLSGDERYSLDPRFEGGKDLSLDTRMPQGQVVHMNLECCFSFHVPVPTELLGAVPSRIVAAPDKKGYLPDFGIAPWGGWKLVSRAFVDIVEQLEPGGHQFLPIAETVDRKGCAVAKQFFLMNILHQFNAVDVERSSVELREKHDSPVFAGKEEKLVVRTMRLLPPQRLVLKRALVAGHHLWHGTTEDIYLVFFSDELHDAVLAAGLSPLRYTRAEEL